MKKGLLIGILLLLCTGCSIGGGKDLSCTYTESNEGLNVKSTIDMHFESNVVNNVKFTMNISPESEDMKDNWSYVEAAYNDKYASIEKDGLKVSNNADSKNKIYTITIEANPQKATKEDLEKYGMGDLAGATDTYEIAKNGLEDEGYSCK